MIINDADLYVNLNSILHNCENRQITKNDSKQELLIIFSLFMHSWHAKYEVMNNETDIYGQTSSISCMKSKNLIVSHLVMQLSLPNPLEPGVKLRMKM